MVSGSQVFVNRFEGTEESNECPSRMRGRAARLAKIAVPELIADGDYRGAHGTVLVRALRPGGLAWLINPDRKAHGY